MKTYKQINQELYSKINDLQTKLAFESSENNLRRKVIDDNNLFDPVKYQEIMTKLMITVDALEHIRTLELKQRLKEPNLPFDKIYGNKTAIEAIASEALERIKEIIK